MRVQTILFALGVVFLTVIVLACAPAPDPNTRATATPPPTTLSAPLTPTELKYWLIAEFGKIFFCDPDLYPVGREVSDQEISERVVEIRKNTEEYDAILKQLGLQGVANLSPEQKRLIDDEHQMLQVLQLEPAGDQFKFSLVTGQEAVGGFAIEGTITSNGVISVTRREPSIVTCPICLAAETRIQTANGDVPVRDIRQGMLVWTATASGERELVVVLQTVKRPVPKGVYLVHLVLDDGRQVIVSAGHPTFDGRLVAELKPGDSLDGAHIVSVDHMPLQGDATYDILPAGETGAYWANGILLDSTLKEPFHQNQ